jgi:formate dehydrogenase iron-sulfur subunit
MTDGSLCAMGGLIPMPVRSAVRHFSGDFQRNSRSKPSDPVGSAGS